MFYMKNVLCNGFPKRWNVQCAGKVINNKFKSMNRYDFIKGLELGQNYKICGVICVLNNIFL